jgi:hypothetical protein
LQALKRIYPILDRMKIRNVDLRTASEAVNPAFSVILCDKESKKKSEVELRSLSLSYGIDVVSCDFFDKGLFIDKLPPKSSFLVRAKRSSEQKLEWAERIAASNGWSTPERLKSRTTATPFSRLLPTFVHDSQAILKMKQDKQQARDSKSKGPQVDRFCLLRLFTHLPLAYSWP